MIILHINYIVNGSQGCLKNHYRFLTLMPKLAILRSRTKVYDIEKRITKIGRGTDNDLILTSSQSISKRHARIEFEESKGNINRDRASLIDLQSRNASFVNKQR